MEIYYMGTELQTVPCPPLVFFFFSLFCCSLFFVPFGFSLSLRLPVPAYTRQVNFGSDLDEIFHLAP